MKTEVIIKSTYEGEYFGDISKIFKMIDLDEGINLDYEQEFYLNRTENRKSTI